MNKPLCFKQERKALVTLEGCDVEMDCAGCFWKAECRTALFHRTRPYKNFAKDLRKIRRVRAARIPYAGDLPRKPALFLLFLLFLLFR